ncbi:hypothetical protein JYT72_02365 [Crocinitomix catalasitica]|nr:hypothetical protein [Crocinitomix catalasitica]
MNSFFIVNSKNITDTVWDLNITLNADHPVYEGHFPEKAIAPGVMLCEMVKHILEEEFGHKLRMTAARNIKFLNLMLPENASDLNLNMEVDQSENLPAGQAGIKIKAEAKIGEDIYFKISANYEAIDQN